MKIPDDVLFKSKLNIYIGNCPTQYGFGGVHGSLKGYFEQATSEMVNPKQWMLALCTLHS